MGDPMKDASVRRARDAERRVVENYEPVVVWVRTPNVELSGGKVSATEVVRRYARDELAALPFVEVATAHEPWCEVRTEYDIDE